MDSKNNSVGWFIDRIYSAHGESVLFVGMTLLYLLPIWSFTYFPSQDGPAHIYNATLIHEFINPTHNIFQKYYVLNTNISPTWFPHLILTALMTIFEPLMAEKVFLTCYVILFICSVRYAINVINPDSRWIIYLAFPLVYSYILYMGFYANSVSYAMAFFVIGYWLRYADNWQAKNLIIFGILELLLYLFHIVSFAMTLGILGVFSLYSIVTDIRKRNFEKQIPDLLKLRIIYPFLTLIPTLIFAEIFLQSRETIFLPGYDLQTRLKVLLHLDFIASFQLLEQRRLAFLYVLLIAVPFVWFLVTKIKQRRVEKYDQLIFAALACTIVFLVVPEISLRSLNGMEGGTFITHRIDVFPYFLIILWLASLNFSVFYKQVLISLSLIMSVALLTMNMYKTAEIQGQIKEYLSAMPYIESNTTVLPLNMDKYGFDPENSEHHLTAHVDPFVHIANHIGSIRHTVMMENYEANLGYFPLLYRDETNPYRHIGSIELPYITGANLSDYEKNTGGKIDYVLVWLGRKIILNQEKTQSIYRQLESKYERIFISENELMEVYHLKK